MGILFCLVWFGLVSFRFVLFVFCIFVHQPLYLNPKTQQTKIEVVKDDIRAIS